MPDKENIAPQPRYPERYPRRILLIILGETPQVVTETLYALAVTSTPRFIPTELHIITTAKGAAAVQESLIERSQLTRLCEDYRLPKIRFDASSYLHVIGAPDHALADIVSYDDSLLTAGYILEVVRNLIGDSHGDEGAQASAIHASLAGGRKTMSYYLGYAMSLLARPQDRLSHVLVDPDFENVADFFYPTCSRRLVFCPNIGAERDAQDATVQLVDLPFLRLREGLHQNHPLLTGNLSFDDSIAAMQRTLHPPRLQIDFPRKEIVCGGVAIEMDRVKRAWYAWFARRAQLGLPPVDADLFWITPPLQQQPVPKPLHAVDVSSVLDDYVAINGEVGGRRQEQFHEAIYENIRLGKPASYFQPVRSDIETALRNALGAVEEVERYAIRHCPAHDTTGRTGYQLDLPPACIEFIAQDTDRTPVKEGTTP